MSYHQAHIVAGPNEFRIPYQTHVGVSKVQFCPEVGSHSLAVSSWDGTVHVYDVGDANDVRENFVYYHGKPALCCTFMGRNFVASGAADNAVKMADIEIGRDMNVGFHAGGVRCIEYNKIVNLIISGSWDSTLKFWDTRNYQNGAVQTNQLSDRVYAMDTKGDKVIVGTRNRMVYVYDIRKMSTPEQSRESPLKYQTRAISLFPTADAFVLSSIEGRVAVEYLDQTAEKKKYAFKCHRSKDATDGTELIYPVNAIAFHPIHNTFATGGSDTIVNLWDPFNRKRLVQLHKFDSSIMSLSFSADGGSLAIASSYGYEQEVDPSPIPDHAITIRRVNDSECRPRS